MVTIYGMANSGNCYKPRLLLAKLGRPFVHVEVEPGASGTQSAGYLAKNPNGKVPLLELDDGRVLAESNAILLSLAEGTPFLPADWYDRGLVYQWLFFEQYSHEPYVAVRRAIMVYPHRRKEATSERMASTLAGGNKAFRVMDEQLSRTSFLAGDMFTVADIALYAYSHDAHRGGFDLSAFPSVTAWLKRVEAHPGHVALEWLPAKS